MGAPLLIVGTGMAGYGLLRALRHVDRRMAVCMVTADDAAAYAKFQLPGALARRRDAGELVLASVEQMAHRYDASILPRTRALRIDRARHILRTDTADLAYGQLVIATGAEPRRPASIRGTGVTSVLTVGSLAEYAYLRSELAGRRRVVVLGGGASGCEFADNLLRGGCDVTLLEPGSRLLGARLPALCSERVAGALHTAGVRLRLEDGIQRIEQGLDELEITTLSGARLNAEVVIAVLGSAPRVQLAADAGVDVGRGIVVDTRLCTSDPDIFALGECAEMGGRLFTLSDDIDAGARVLAGVLTGGHTQLRWQVRSLRLQLECCPTVLCEPPPIAGEWHETATARGVRALFHDFNGRLRGFVLVGEAVSDAHHLLSHIGH
ncbi:NAD(P)/FAD-dependent oxidoreductase [Aromatoleum diolicum]|uniref:SidA/IucD/PvdA family monooxygenase n=1 Tax=Aromatoleum diolicum TaxID=75796 RepID=A0ABX1Q8F3_9RHOO|nr:FAD-dependent oxidoreductase [Aromatoleum diolicum]NMG74634.1 SidA/IucD/PvdA family monooxygenase [Aromatoleum diolicum]